MPPLAGVGDMGQDEDAPETILFYGGEYEGDGFFWCLDKSCSMVGDQIAVLKDEVNAAIISLSSAADIGLVAFSTNVVLWRTSPARASSAYKAGAEAWVNTLVASGGTKEGEARHISGGSAIITIKIVAARVVADQEFEDQRFVLYDLLATDELANKCFRKCRLTVSVPHGMYRRRV